MRREPLNEKPWKHQSKHGTVFTSSRCDLRDGITAHVTNTASETDLIEDVSEMIGFHATNVREQLNGFQGYDTLRYTIERPIAKPGSRGTPPPYREYPGIIIPHLVGTNEDRWPPKLKEYLEREISWKPGSGAPGVDVENRTDFDQAVRRWCTFSMTETEVVAWIRMNSGILEAMGVR